MANKQLFSYFTSKDLTVGSLMKHTESNSQRSKELVVLLLLYFTKRMLTISAAFKYEVKSESPSIVNAKKGLSSKDSTSVIKEFNFIVEYILLKIFKYNSTSISPSMIMQTVSELMDRGSAPDVYIQGLPKSHQSPIKTMLRVFVRDPQKYIFVAGDMIYQEGSKTGLYLNHPDVKSIWNGGDISSKKAVSFIHSVSKTIKSKLIKKTSGPSKSKISKLQKLTDIVKAKQTSYSEYQKVFEKVVFGEQLPPHKELDTPKEAKIYWGVESYVDSTTTRTKKLEIDLAFIKKAQADYAEFTPPKQKIYRGISVKARSAFKMYLDQISKAAAKDKTFKTQVEGKGINKTNMIVLDTVYKPYYGIESWSIEYDIAFNFSSALSSSAQSKWKSAIQNDFKLVSEEIEDYIRLLKSPPKSSTGTQYKKMIERSLMRINEMGERTLTRSARLMESDVHSLIFMLPTPDNYCVFSPKLLSNRISAVALGLGKASSEGEVIRFSRTPVKCSLLYPEYLYIQLAYANKFIKLFEDFRKTKKPPELSFFIGELIATMRRAKA